MKTLIIIVKEYDKNFMLRHCQIQDFEYVFEKKQNHFDYLDRKSVV